MRGLNLEVNGNDVGWERLVQGTRSFRVHDHPTPSFSNTRAGLCEIALLAALIVWLSLYGRR